MKGDLNASAQFKSMNGEVLL